MNFLAPSRAAVNKIVVALALATTFVVSIAAQKVEPQSQGKMYGEPGFRGEPINLNVVNADIRDILSYITDQYSINFVIDKSVAMQAIRYTKELLPGSFNGGDLAVSEPSGAAASSRRRHTGNR